MPRHADNVPFNAAGEPMKRYVSKTRLGMIERLAPAEEFAKAYESKSTYREIGTRFGITTNDVASLAEYRGLAQIRQLKKEARRPRVAPPLATTKPVLLELNPEHITRLADQIFDRFVERYGAAQGSLAIEDHDK
jgi:hypothetical protein